MANLKAPAISGKSPLVAMAVLAMMAAAPISMAAQACEGLPMPASTIMGRSISAIKILMNSPVHRPLLLPIGAARGMMQAAPASRKSRATCKSGYI